MDKFDVIIGLEIHAELNTASKMFCRCDNDSIGKEPNVNTCPVCLGHPGTLPVANRSAIESTVLVGLALNCQVNQYSKFDRKNYFYPDLPKGYQISQFDLPLVYGGFLEVDGEKIEITRIHLEEDTGKLSHPAGRDYSLVDYNRAGTPLMEMVTEPVIKNAQTAKKFCQNYQQILRYLGVANADMEKGEMRCEANVSLQEKGKWLYEDGLIKPVGDYKLNPKVELKNINSFKAVEKAVEYEIARQLQAIENGEKLYQETRGWNEAKQATVRQRIKETSADYRYFPDPDIPPVRLSDEMIAEIRTNLVELPQAKQERFAIEYGLSATDAEILVSDKPLADYTEQVISELHGWLEAKDLPNEGQKGRLAKLTSNWLISELFKHLKTDNLSIKDLHITANDFAKLIVLLFEGKINSSAGQTILEKMYQSEAGIDPEDLVRSMGL
ncbi:Asp-tRNA(Asn)/Glu-tRNA(Gln) amidotransferase subunit GatB, partial [Candidatus Falkowbacteria bacterium]|nr:Asp-tRNA(Asn)/Glu-tRNA(Gln) amidotransferase subunit GatB [Candidatus Falkowbacteria bacterium]